MTPQNLLDHYKKVPVIAGSLGVTRATFYQWVKKGIPLERQIKIEVLTDGALKADLPEYFRKQTA